MPINREAATRTGESLGVSSGDKGQPSGLMGPAEVRPYAPDGTTPMRVLERRPGACHEYLVRRA